MSQKARNKAILPLRPSSPAERLAAAHPFLKQLVSLAVACCAPDSIVLFGSRARGDHHERSDFDVALKGVKSDDRWAELCVTLAETAETLAPFDLIRYEEVSRELQAKIDQEGTALYERESKA